MPKQKRLSDSDSDSGPEDRNPVKKSKSSSSSSGSKDNGSKKNSEGDSYWEIGSRKRVTVRTFKGTVYVDIREFYEKNGEYLPGKKGISMKAGEWNLIKNLADQIDEEVRTK